MGSNVDPIVDATARVLEAGRSAGIPIFFTTYD
jgi:nicotinamidase-related amidase